MTAKVTPLRKPDEPVSHPHSHTGLADAFCLEHGDDARYVYQFGKWITWDGTRWKRDDAHNVADIFTGLARRQVVDVERIVSLTAAKLTGLKKDLMAKSYRDGGEAIARTMPRFTVSASLLDADSALLNTPSGTIDLRNGEIRDHSRAELLTRCTTVAPDSNGIPGTRFATFLQEITQSDIELQQYLRRALGACLFGANCDGVSGDHWLLFLSGSGRNGKNTLMDVVQYAIGDYAKTVPTSLLAARERDQHPTELANLCGMRLAVCSETENGMRWAEAKIKSLTGDATITGRFMRQDFFEFPRTHRHVVYGNHRPRLANPDIAIKSRLHVVPFRASFAGREDTALPARLKSEAPKVLEWLVSGAVDYFEAGQLNRCTAVSAESDDYFASQATFDMWLGERTINDEGAWEHAKALYADFRQWKEDRGEAPPSQTLWGEEMAARFRRTVRGGVGTVYHGLRLPAFAKTS